MLFEPVVFEKEAFIVTGEIWVLTLNNGILKGTRVECEDLTDEGDFFITMGEVSVPFDEVTMISKRIFKVL